MQYKELDYLLALKEERQISRAALRLNVSQSTFSLYLQRIEKRFGTKFYDRRLQCLTPAGEVYCNGAEKIISLHNKAMESISRLSALNSLKFAVDINLAVFFQGFLSAMINEFNREYPDIVVYQYFLDEKQIIDLLSNEKLDLAYCYLTDSISVIEKFPVISEHLLVASPNTDVQNENKSSTCTYPDNLFKTHEYIGIFKDSNLRIAIDMALFSYKITPNPTVESCSYELTNHLMESGRYITVIPSTMTERFSKYALYPLDPSFTARSGFVYDSNILPPYLTYFMDLTRTHLQAVNRKHNNKCFNRVKENIE